AVRYPYFIPRNTQGSIPVYTDYRNHNKVLTLIRNVQGNVDALVADLTKSLVEPGSPEAARLKVTVSRGRHIALQGGNWKRQVMKWLESKGF
ncbi:ribosomal protein L49/IMG2, partial [Cytidiella melzeri]